MQEVEMLADGLDQHGVFGRGVKRMLLEHYKDIQFIFEALEGEFGTRGGVSGCSLRRRGSDLLGGRRFCLIWLFNRGV